MIITKVRPVRCKITANQSEDHFLVTNLQQRVEFSHYLEVGKERGHTLHKTGAWLVAAPVVVEGTPMLNVTVGTPAKTYTLNLDIAGCMAVVDHMLTAIKVIQSEVEGMQPKGEKQ